MIVPVAGIGASAGGLEACKLLLAHLPANPGLAFVLVHHNDNLDLMLHGPGAIPVRHAAQGMAVEPGCLYVAPPGVGVEIANRVLSLSPGPAPSPHMPFDRFLLSLAKECGSRAIGVVLSGTGEDGATGLEAVKACGGVTVAQDPATAEFACMPQAAIVRGCVDLVLPPEAIAARLAELGHHPYVVEDHRILYTGAGAQFEIVLALLRGATGIDFDLDRDTWVQRRILRRLALCNLESLAEYCTRLENDPAELGALHRDLLLCTTGSFRDLQSFETLKHLVFPRILQGRPPRAPVRVWVPGCATGEDAFSIAVTLSEYLDQAGVSVPIRIFASDTSANFIERARWGRYPERIAADISPVRLNRHFIRIDGGYQIDKELRETCVFTRHNLLADPPFSKLDLVSCRNLPVHTAREQNIIPMFHYALKPNGFLIFGGSQTAALRELFSPVDPARGIYVRREAARKPHALRPATAGEPHPDKLTEAPRTVAVGNDSGFRQEVDRILLSRYSPAGVVVDEDLEVLEIRGDAGSFLSLPAGKISSNLFKLIPEAGLFLEVESLVHAARSTGRPARREGIPFDGGSRTGEVAVEVVPLPSRKNTLLILFEPTGGAAETADAPSPPVEAAGLNDRRIERLKLDLADARKRLEAAVEEHRISREENLKSAEEALCTTEELQSLNQELETAKEELQSTNETLTAVNQQLQSNIAALTAAPGFALSVIETATSPLLILDTHLRIKAANPSFYDAFHLLPSETEGRLLYSVSNGSWDIPGLRVMLEHVLPDQKAIRGFEVEQDFPVIGHRALVISARRLDRLPQILMGIEDVTERRRAEAILHESEQRFGSMADAAPVMIWVSGPEQACTFFNKGWLQFTGRTMQQEVGDGWTAGVHPLDLDRCIGIYSSSFQARRGFQMEYRLRRADGEYRWLLDNGVPRFETGGTFAGYVGSCTDITDLKRTQEEDLAKQKLESVGTLAGGIAHDFNNLLGGVLAHAELALVELADGSSPEPELNRIRAVAIRGSEIVRQLMIYAGQETEVPDLVDVSRIVEDMIELLKVAVSKHATVETSLGRDLPAVRANPAQLRQVVMNLITNASEALGDRDGVIRIATEHVNLTRESLAAPSERLPEGDYLQLLVSDTGRGMTPQTQARVFDPFFTTRQAGHGLGLSVVQGVVRGLGGTIHVESAPGKGTIFQIFLPCAGRPAPVTVPAAVPPQQPKLAAPKATILIVEDEDSMRLPLSITLRKAGLTILEASDGHAALGLLRTYEGRIDVLLLDITLPGISSRRIFEAARLLRPRAEVIVTSAYGREKAAASLAASVGHFIRKPYRLEDLMHLIRGVLAS